MMDEPQIVQTVAQQTAVIHVTVPRDQIQKVMGPGYIELVAAVAAQGMPAGGPWFTHHLAMHPDKFDFEIGLPVALPIAPAGRVQPGQLPAGRVARGIYRGPYEGLADAWAEMDAWISKHGYTARPDLWEVYVEGPESSPDPAKWQTQLNRPLVASS
jgi:effector-binding domain-containing protein